ncbi:DUF2382 domain-containing protein [Luteococcus sp. Sow4_B9]|uniref:DUF2382 domain-containing protein n=1 Tax=Luteococcus sp. Sow4_B9 TaxID=3438792 RepID=UPI003F98A38F
MSDEELTTAGADGTVRTHDDGMKRTHDDGVEVTRHEERIVAHAEKHEWATVKVTRRIVTEERTITIPVRREELVVEYPDESVPAAHPSTVRGSTDTVNSRVVATHVLHQEVPRVVVDTVPYEEVQLIVDTQRSAVEVEETLAKERLSITTDPEIPVQY